MIPGSLSKPPPSASRPPHRMELTIVAQGLADFRLSTPIVDFARLSLKLSLSRRRDAWRPREGRPRSRYCIARTRSGSCVPSSASRRAPGCRRGRDCGRRFCGSRAGHDGGGSPGDGDVGPAQLVAAKRTVRASNERSIGLLVWPCLPRLLAENKSGQQRQVFLTRAASLQVWPVLRAALVAGRVQAMNMSGFANEPVVA